MISARIMSLQIRPALCGELLEGHDEMDCETQYQSSNIEDVISTTLCVVGCGLKHFSIGLDGCLKAGASLCRLIL